MKVEVHSRCATGGARRCAAGGALEVRWGCAGGALGVRWRCAGVRLRCA